MLPRLVFFDVDNTLAESKQPMVPSMVALMTKLLQHTKVAITSGAKFSLIKFQVPDTLPEELRPNLYLLPTSGSALYVYENADWKAIYENRFTDEEVQEVSEVLKEAGKETGLIDFSSPSVGERIEFRGSEVALTAPGQDAPIEVKAAWDPDRAKRTRLREYIVPRLPRYEIRIAGRSTIDVTKKGIDKAYGVRKLSAHLDIPIEDMLYVGDALFPGGNDEVVKESGIKTIQVERPSDTERVIADLLSKV